VNKAIDPYPELAQLPIDDLLRRLDQVPETIRASVRNNGGAPANHQFFWQILGPHAGGSPKGAIADAITKDVVDERLRAARAETSHTSRREA
jgi:Fe-Mn family superoxide dismutase